MVLQRYANCFTKEELSPTFDIRSQLVLSEVMKRFGDISGVKFSERIENYENGKFLALQNDDVEDLTSRVSHMGIIDHADAISVFLSLQEQKNSYNSGEKVKLILFAWLM